MYINHSNSKMDIWYPIAQKESDKRREAISVDVTYISNFSSLSGELNLKTEISYSFLMMILDKTSNLSGIMSRQYFMAEY